MIDDRERWAIVSHLKTRHGEAAPVFVAERVGEMALRGDAGGVELWRDIARRMNEMLGMSGVAKH